MKRIRPSDCYIQAQRWFMLLLLFSMGLQTMAQSQPESSTNRLEVRSKGEHYKTYQSFGDSAKLSVRTNESKKWIRGRIHEIQDSSITVDDRPFQISQITEIRTKLSWSTVFAGFVVFLITCGLGILGWIFGRAILQKRPVKFWQWALVIVGAFAVLILGPILLATTLLVWAFARTKYTIGRQYRLQVHHKADPNAANKSDDHGIPDY